MEEGNWDKDLSYTVYRPHHHFAQNLFGKKIAAYTRAVVAKKNKIIYLLPIWERPFHKILTQTMRKNVEHNFKRFMGSRSNYKKLKNTFPLRLYKISDDSVNVARLYFDA